MKWNKKGAAAVLILALLLAGGASIRPALAYFTTYTETEGGITLALAPDTEIEEEVDGMEKYIRIRNTGNESVWVRAKLFYPDGWSVGPEITDSEGNAINIRWESVADEDSVSENAEAGEWVYDDSSAVGDGSGWWYYSEQVPAGEVTNTLHIIVNPPEGFKGSFDVIVIYEYTVAKDEDESAQKADWEATVSSNDPGSDRPDTSETDVAADDDTAEADAAWIAEDGIPVSGAAAWMAENGAPTDGAAAWMAENGAPADGAAA